MVAPWLPGYDAPATGSRSARAPMCATCSTRVRRAPKADERAVLIGHDWGALHRIRSGGKPIRSAFSRFVALAVPPVAALAGSMFTYAPAQAVVLHLVHPAGRTRRGHAAGARILGVALGGLVTGIRCSTDDFVSYDDMSPRRTSPR